MGIIEDSGNKVGAHPLLILNAKGQSHSLGARSTEMQGGLKDSVIPSMTGIWHLSNGENIHEIYY